jgi:hypothetical protein
LKSLLRVVSPIEKGHIFKIPLKTEDVSLLRTIAKTCKNSIADCMKAADIHGAFKHWNLIESLTIIEHETSFKNMQLVRKCVIDLVQKWQSDVRALHAENNGQDRAKVRSILELLKISLPLAQAATSANEQVEGQSVYEAVLAEVKIKEAEYQHNVNTLLQSDFRTVQDGLCKAIVEKADEEIAAYFDVVPSCPASGSSSSALEKALLEVDNMKVSTSFCRSFAGLPLMQMFASERTTSGGEKKIVVEGVFEMQNVFLCKLTIWYPMAVCAGV